VASPESCDKSGWIRFSTIRRVVDQTGYCPLRNARRGLDGPEFWRFANPDDFRETLLQKSLRSFTSGPFLKSIATGEAKGSNILSPQKNRRHPPDPFRVCSSEGVGEIFLPISNSAPLIEVGFDEVEARVVAA
jgi:hypothetical protein